MEDEGRVDAGLLLTLARRIGEDFGSTTTRVRFRSSSNVEDILEFNGAGLYESTSGCAADQLDGDDAGPSHCPPRARRERDIERALKRVWASLWNSRAYEERAFFRIPQESAAMGVLVTRAFLNERANGVAFTGNPANVADRRYVITAQAGDVSVVSPPPGVLPEKDVLIVDDQGQVILIDRPLSSTLLPEGRHVLSDEILRELGELLFHIDRNFPVELGEYRREQVLFDVEFKVEESGELAVKQVRPFLVTQPPPETRTFWLEVPGETELCGAWIEGRSPLEEHAVKSRLRLAPGRHELPTAVDVFFGGNLIEEVLFGEERERLEPESAGLYRVDTRAAAGGEVQYTFSYEQTFRRPGGESFEVRLEFLEFRVKPGEPVESTRLVDEEFITEGLVLSGTPGGDPNRRVRYSSCTYESIPLWIVSVELADGTQLRLEERFREAPAGNGPAALSAAEVVREGERRESRDYWDLTYAALHHNLNRRYLVVLEPPLSFPPFGPARAVELVEPIRGRNLPARAILRGMDLEVLGEPRVTRFTRCQPPDCPTDFRRGDANTDGGINLSDAVFVLDHLFRGGRASHCPDAADFDDSGVEEITDAILILHFLFRGIDLSEPPGPYDCGFDPTDDSLGEECRVPGCP